MHLSDRDQSRIDELVDAGRYADAAAAAREAGDPKRAAALYERIWMFAEAAACAREAGDLGAALRYALDAREDALVTDAISALRERGEEGRKLALSVLEAKRRFADAAPIAEALGQRDHAIGLYQRAHMELDAARLLEAAGRVREAGRALERVLEHSEAADERARAHLQLGLLFARRMQHESAARHLQEAAKHAATQRRAKRALVVELAGLELRDAARDVLLAARRDDPALPIDVDELVREERERLADDAARDEDEAPLVAGRYRLGDAIGAGGSGRVYVATDEVTGREVAVKLFHSALSRDRNAYERFVREAEVARSLRHPNVVDVHRVAPEHGALIMERMVGGSLADRLPPPLRGPGARRLALDVLDGLEAAHQRGIIHRDVKPANIFFDARGTAKLGDFGIAHLLDLGQTQTGGLIGTLAYMAPEQITGADLTIAADLYGLGVTLYEALTGRLPFLGPDFVAQHLGEAPPPPSEVSGDVAPAWNPILERLLAKSPDDRYADIEELRRDLEEIDLGAEDEPKPLALPRGGAAEAPSRERTPRWRARRESAAPAPSSERAGSRYAYEKAFRQTENAEIARALDTALDRTVIIERYAKALDAATEARLFRLARGSGPYLQRVLGFERDAGVAIYEAPAGEPLEQAIEGAPIEARRAVRMLMRLSRAVALVHDEGGAHGAIAADKVLIDDDGYPTLLAAGLGPAPADARPEDDGAAIIDIVAAALGVESGPDALARALGDENAAEGLRRARSGEDLYAIAEAIEIEILARRRRPSRPPAPHSA